MAITQHDFEQFYQYSAILDTMARNANADQVQKYHLELMTGFAWLLSLIAQDRKGVSLEDVGMVDRLSRDSTSLEKAVNPITGLSEAAQEKQPDNGWRPNRATTADSIQHRNLVEYNSCLQRSLQALKLQLEGSFDRALVIYYEIEGFAKGKPHLETHLELLNLCRDKFESQGR